MITEINVSPELMIELSDRKLKCAEQFKEAKEKYAEHKVGYTRLLGKQIALNPKMGIEKLISVSMDNPTFDTHYKGFVYYKALATGLEAELEAISTKIISIQSFLKYCGNNDGGRR